jgi:transcriptional regulator with XRE-family HTH domain
VKNNRIDANQSVRAKEFMITASQCRAARGLLDWTQQELADAARIGVATVRQLEGSGAETRQATLAVLKWALETAGIEFIDENGGGPGVRLRKKLPKKG